MLHFIFLLFISGHADMQNPQEPEKQKGLKYYVTLCSLMIQQAHSIQAPEVFSVCQTNKALFIKVVSKQQYFQLLKQTHTRQGNNCFSPWGSGQSLMMKTTTDWLSTLHFPLSLPDIFLFLEGVGEWLMEKQLLKQIEFKTPLILVTHQPDSFPMSEKCQEIK